jgi:uncharacterized OsmC-like protein
MDGELVWKGNLLFEGACDITGHKVLFDAHPHSGGNDIAATPMEHLLLAVAACTAIDVDYDFAQDEARADRLPHRDSRRATP